MGEVHPSLRKDFRPVAYFNPALMTDSAVRATIDFKLPDTTTAYRVFAVVCDKRSGFVSGQRKMVVTKEFFVEPSPPRFFCPGDKVVFPLVLHNKTAGKGVATIQAKGSDIMRVDILNHLAPWSPIPDLKSCVDIIKVVMPIRIWLQFNPNFVNIFSGD